MKIEQIKLSRMATFCYLVADESSGNAAFIDPAFDVPVLLKKAEAGGFKITHLINTHHHADHSAGNAEVIKATGAKLCIHHLDARKLNNLPGKIFSRLLGGKGSPGAEILLNDGDKIQIGALELDVLHTPGHTPGGICLYGDGNVFSGDTLFVGAVGRTDLPGGSTKQLLASIRDKLGSLPDETVVWPGHDYGNTKTSTIGNEMRFNPFLQ